MTTLFSKLKSLITTTNWRKTSFASMISGGLFLVIAPLNQVTDGQCPEMVWTILGVFILSQLAAWFGGIFRAAFGAFSLLLSAVLALIFICFLPVSEITLWELPFVVPSGLFIVGLPLLMRYDFYSKKRHEPECVVEL